MRKQRMLWDMDGVLCQLIEELIDYINLNYEDLNLTDEHANDWNFWEHLVNREASKQTLIQMHSEGFFTKLKPYAAAVDVFKQMVALGHEVVICTAPLQGEFRERSMGEKIEWVRKFLGEEFVGSIIFSSDKTEVPGDVIIDDKPNLTVGASNIQFKNWLLVEHTYNRYLPEMDFTPTGQIKLDWSNWEEEFFKLDLI